MASTLSLENLADLTELTLNQYKRDAWTELTSDLQEYVAMPLMLKKSNVEIATSHTFEWKVRTTTSGNARNVGMFSVDVTNVNDVMTNASISLRHTEGSFMYDRSEFLANQGNSERIVSLILSRRTEAYVDLADQMETDWWGKPTDSSDTTTPHGIDYWIVPKVTGDSLSTGTGEFGGGNPGSGWYAGGINSSTVSRWANWTHQYVDVSQEDLITKMRRGAYKTKFKPPVNMPLASFGGGGMPMGFYGPYTVVATMERLLTFQNDNLGNDLASKDGKTMFKGAPVTAVPKLDSDATNPVFQINWKFFKPVFLKGAYIDEGPVKPKAGMHNVLEAHIDATWTSVCFNRRAHAVYAIA